MIDYTISTNLIRVIEGARDKIPDEAYKLATNIARELTEILDKSSNVALSADYEYNLKSLATRDIPDSFSYYTSTLKDASAGMQEQMKDNLLGQLVTILESVAEIKEAIEQEMLSNMKAHSRYITDKYKQGNKIDDEETTPDEVFDVTSARKRAILEAPALENTEKGTKKNFFRGIFG